MSNLQQGDVELFQTDNDGDIDITNGRALMVGGLNVSVYLSLFGGNKDDDASAGNVSKSWWGNIGEVPEKQYRSTTQNLLGTIPATSNNLLRVKDAVKADLAWMLNAKIASEINIGVSIPALNTIHIDITITAQGVETDFSYTENWKALPHDIAIEEPAGIFGEKPIVPPVIQTYEQLIISRNPISYFRVGELIVDTVAVDQMGANNGTYTGTVTKEQPALIANNADKSILIGTGASGINFASAIPLGSIWTLEAWITRLVAVNSFHTIFFNQAITRALYIRNGFIDYWDGASNTTTLPMDTTIPNHIVMTFNSGTFNMYVNGVDLTPVLNTAGNMNDVFYIGYNSAAEAFDGFLDELAIYGYVLSATEVLENYNKGIGI